MSYEILPRDDSGRDGSGRDAGTGMGAGVGGGSSVAGSAGTSGRASGPGPAVGRFRQADEASQWILRRYLLVRALGASVVRTVQWFAFGLVAICALLWIASIHWLAVLVGVIAVGVLLLRSLLSGIQRRLSGADALGPAAPQVERLVGRTRREIRAELRRIGLPSAPWGPTLIGLRLLRPVKRAQTVRALASFDLERIAPPSALDELYLLLRGIER